MHISKIIDYVKNEINFSQEFCEDNVFVTLRTEAILRLIENLEQSHKDILEITKENEKKDKIIDEMAKWINKIDSTIFCNKSECNDNCKECVIKEFTKKVEKGE